MQSLLNLRARLSAQGVQIGTALIGLSVCVLTIGVVDFLLRHILGLSKDTAFYQAILALCTLGSLAFPRLIRRAAPPTDTVQED